ncbi:hypothetical protein [Alteromonas sp. 14N.309.X.WAT.G.H12]|uniref:hypothetical protein n=1 Tax=Alteromonas sp. 14N.309.X.WAT.G.H12 TaxID=3120824 RepID=UPI002FD3DE58
MAHQTQLARTLFGNIASLIENAGNILLNPHGENTNSLKGAVRFATKSVRYTATQIQEEDTRPFQYETRNNTIKQEEQLSVEGLAQLKTILHTFRDSVTQHINETLGEVIKLPTPPAEEADNIVAGTRYFVGRFTEINGEMHYPTVFLMIVPPEEDANDKLHSVFSTCRGENVKASADFVTFFDGLAAKEPNITEISKPDFDIMQKHLAVL